MHLVKRKNDNSKKGGIKMDIIVPEANLPVPVGDGCTIDDNCVPKADSCKCNGYICIVHW